MSERLYSFFRQTEKNHSDDLLFSQAGWVRYNVPFKKISLLILNYKGRSYHYLNDDKWLEREYHHGEELKKFLQANGAKVAEVDIEKIDNAKKGIFTTTSGEKLKLNCWYNEHHSQYKHDVYLGVKHLMKFTKGHRLEIDEKQKELTVEFVHQGPAYDPQIRAGFKAVKRTKIRQTLFLVGIIAVIVAIYVLATLF